MVAGVALTTDVFPFDPAWLTIDDAASCDPAPFGRHIPGVALSDAMYRRGLHCAHLVHGERYLELGCGAGRGLVIAAREFGAVSSGIDADDASCKAAERRCQRSGIAATIEHGDVRACTLDADVIHMHLGPAFHDLLASRMERLITSPTTRVIAARWGVPGWLADGVDVAGDNMVYRPGDPLLHAMLDYDPDAHQIIIHACADLDEAVLIRNDSASVPVGRLARGQSRTVELPQPRGASVTYVLHALGRDGMSRERGAAVDVAG